jgi:hypothetical protein
MTKKMPMVDLSKPIKYLFFSTTSFSFLLLLSSSLPKRSLFPEFWILFRLGCFFILENLTKDY